jgi:hypothetical protein
MEKAIVSLSSRNRKLQSLHQAQLEQIDRLKTQLRQRDANWQ